MGTIKKKRARSFVGKTKKHEQKHTNGTTSGMKHVLNSIIKK